MKYRESISATAKKFGISRMQIYKLAKKIGRLPTEKELHELYKDRDKVQELIKSTGCKKEHIYLFKKRHGRLPTIEELKERRTQNE